MENIIQRALNAKRESKHIEFKSAFDLSSAHHWCELIKDIVAIANTGSGAMLFGVDNFGNPCGLDIQPILQLDMATITDKVSRYTTVQFSEFEVVQAEKSGTTVALLLMSQLIFPLSLVVQAPTHCQLANSKPHFHAVQSTSVMEPSRNLLPVKSFASWENGIWK
jgi:hypothetical protein